MNSEVNYDISHLIHNSYYNSFNIGVVMSDGKTDAKRGVKFDQEKVQYHYMSPIAIDKLNKVLSFGARKYSAHNWRGGIAWSRVIGAAFRHIFSWLNGETNDPETGLNHLAHAMCCLMFLLEFEETHPELDDRYKREDDLTKMFNDLQERDKK